MSSTTRLYGRRTPTLPLNRRTTEGSTDPHRRRPTVYDTVVQGYVTAPDLGDINGGNKGPLTGKFTSVEVICDPLHGNLSTLKDHPSVDTSSSTRPSGGSLHYLTVSPRHYRVSVSTCLRLGLSSSPEGVDGDV